MLTQKLSVKTEWTKIMPLNFVMQKNHIYVTYILKFQSENKCNVGRLYLFWKYLFSKTAHQEFVFKRTLDMTIYKPSLMC
jgi:hypothetical protein